MLEPHVPYDVFPVVSCGVDWLTLTAKRRGLETPLEVFGDRIVKDESAATGRAVAALRLGFQGRRSLTSFVGVNDSHVMVQISGPSCTPLAAEAISYATNVSRIDLQVTVFCEGEQPRLARWTREVLEARYREGRPKRKLRLIEGTPEGETLEVGRRVSAQFGRLYDKTAEASLGPPRLVWRYELEAKGKRAQWLADRLAKCGVRPTVVSRCVHDYYTRTGVQPAFAMPADETAFQPFITTPSKDVLSWFRASVSKTVAKAINEHGRQLVLEALGISDPHLGG